MSEKLQPSLVEQIQAYDDEKRATYFFKEVVLNNKIWILTDEHGCVMLNTEEDDCIPVWPNEEFAQAWATDEWQACQAESISLNKWFSRWSHGLADDQLAVVVFPNQAEQGLVFFPDEIDFELKKQQKKK
ncbi:MAG: DUF2750 domain-containing protein [Colwellia sp.]|nr:DUF2750 domain-containing protein [Colwellia sp.]